MTLVRRMLFIGIGFCLCLAMFAFASVRADSSRAQTQSKTQVKPICPMSYVEPDRPQSDAFAPNASGIHRLMTREEFKKILAESGQTLEEFDAQPMFDPMPPWGSSVSCGPDDDNEDGYLPGEGLVVLQQAPTRK